MRTQKVVVVPYDPQWKRDFEQIKREITEAAGPLLAGVEHVGSTAVEGLSAKPIIDIDVVIRDWAVFDSVVCALGRIGYVHEGNLGIPEREAFCYEGKTHLRAHHLYVCPQDSRNWHGTLYSGISCAAVPKRPGGTAVPKRKRPGGSPTASKGIWPARRRLLPSCTRCAGFRTGNKKTVRFLSGPLCVCQAVTAGPGRRGAGRRQPAYTE